MGAVKLLGAWPSPFSYRVIWALKLKGIPYEYVEQDLMNKSSLLLQCNPVHKKVPVLLHGSNPICESLVIIEYLDQTWPQYPLLPSDPYERAKARFWVKFFEDKSQSIGIFFGSKGEKQEKAVKDTIEMLRTIEEHAMEDMGDKKYFGGDNIGIVDIAYGGIAHWLGVMEKLVGIKVLEPHKFPKLHAWTQNFKQASVIRDNLPDPDDMFTTFKRLRETILASS